ncbi:MAG: helix-turn-helix domain-containing protein [Planctomycetota bacterium]
MLEPERRILKAALDANDWNRSETARQLGIDRTTLYKKIRKFRLDEPG